MVHFDDDVATTNEFAIHVQLWKGRPVGVGLQTFANLQILKNIHESKRLADGIQRCNRLARETELWKILRALHVNQYLDRYQLFFDTVI
jgi:hypothetical protein